MPAEFAGKLQAEELQPDRAPSEGSLSAADSAAFAVPDAGQGHGHAQLSNDSERSLRARADYGSEPAASVTVLPAARSAMPAVRSAVRSSSDQTSSLPASATGQTASNEADALQILLQASAAAETLQNRFSELQLRRSELAAEHRQLEADRRAFEQHAQEFVSQVARDRSLQREMQLELEQRLARATEKEEAIDRTAAELKAAQRSLSEERVVLKQALKAELDDERQQLEEQRRQLAEERRQTNLTRDEYHREHTERLQQIELILNTEKQKLADRVRDEISSELAQLNREKQEWRQQREQQKTELQQQAEDLQQQREVFGEQLEAEQQRLREEVEKRRQMLLTEQSNLQRRYRFQFEHLGRAREDLEIEVRELRREQQLLRTDRHRFSEQHRLRFTQLLRIRQKLEETEASLGRELRLIERTRTAAMSDIGRLQRRAEEEREAMLQDLETRRVRLRQQEHSLTELAQRLEERSQRLARLRAELDKTQGEILEQRLAIEEAKSGLFRDPTASEIARARLEQARGDVQVFFDRVRGQINSERDKIEIASAELTERQQQFRRDRAELENWFAEREAMLQARSADSVVDELQQQLEARQIQLQEFQERWKADRREAEHSIRELLDQLTSLEIKAFESAGTGQPYNPAQPNNRDAA